MKRLLIIILALPLVGCEWQTFKSSVAGSCAVFERPPYAVRGATGYDQRVADGFVESGVAGCNWRRPAPRPPELDAARRRAEKAAPPRPGVFRSVRQKLWPATPAPLAPSPPVEPASIPQVAPPPPPTAMERLLGGRR